MEPRDAEDEETSGVSGRAFPEVTDTWDSGLGETLREEEVAAAQVWFFSGRSVHCCVIIWEPRTPAPSLPQWDSPGLSRDSPGLSRELPGLTLRLGCTTGGSCSEAPVS